MYLFFFFNDTATTEIYTLSLHDALPIYRDLADARHLHHVVELQLRAQARNRSEEHTSELQSQSNLVCRLLLEKKKKKEIHSSFSSHSHTYIKLPLLYSTHSMLRANHLAY